MELNFREENALGLPTVRIYGESIEQILALAQKLNLDFMPTGNMVAGFISIDARDAKD